MHDYRAVRLIRGAKAVVEGAGVRLYRAVGLGDPEECDPFLLLDDFRSDDPRDYSRGFPWHPHRGIETITYVLKGTVEHEDSIGNKGVIGPGDVQWMTAGSGIFHQEMPRGDGDGSMHGFQLWANLPASDKMKEPRYRGIRGEDIPKVTTPNGVVVKIIAGAIDGTTGPIVDVVNLPEYYDVRLPENVEYAHRTTLGSTVLIYVYEGSGSIVGSRASGGSGGLEIGNRSLILFEDGRDIAIKSGAAGLKYLYVSGAPLREPIAWRGPIVMNTREELRLAYEELDNGTFIKTNTRNRH
ncbi:MAG TPA: pirin family protein [Spirochaetales bacterium]|nr:pirin family protein [Spirochaetales bacterium]